MIHNDGLRSRSHIPPSKTNETERKQASKATQSPQENTEEPQSGSAKQEDSAKLSQHATEGSHHAVNLLEFADQPSAGQLNTAPEGLSVEAFEDDQRTQSNSFNALSERFKESQSNLDDPAVQELLDYIREVEDQNVQALLDGLDASLERAHQMLEENMKHFYDKIKPQMDQIKTEIKTMIAEAKQSQSTELSQAKDKLKYIMQGIHTQLSQAQGDPGLLQQIKNNLDLSQVLNTLK